MDKYASHFIVVIVCSFILFSGCDEENMLPEIKEDTFWEVVVPSSQQIDESVLADLASRVESIDKIYSLLIARNGKIVHEEYHNGAKKNTLLHIRSITKRVTSSLVGIAIDQSSVESINAPVTAYFPELLAPNINPGWGKVNVYHLINMISGIDWIEQRDLRAFEDNFHDPLPFIFSRNIEHEPATYFSYNSPGSHLLSYIVERSTGQNLTEFAGENLFESLGINGFNWESDGNEVKNGGVGLELTARDMTKMGLLYLQNGKWGNQQLISEQWIEESLNLPVNLDTLQGSYLPGSTQSINQPGLSFGNMWWTDNFQGKLIHYGDGYGGQILLIIPAYEVIVVMNHIHTVNGDENRKAFDAFFGEILPAVFESIIE